MTEVAIKAPYKYTIPIEKAFVGEDGKLRLTGAATGPEVDLEDQRVHPSLIDKWVGQINNGLSEIIYDDWHKKDSVVSELGTVEKAWKNEQGHMYVQILLDEDNPVSQYIHKAARKGKQYGMSIFGECTRYADEIVSGRRVRTIIDGTLERIAHTTRPIWTPSFGTVLSKAIDTAASGSANGETQVGETTVTPQTPEATPATEPEANPDAATTESGAATNPDTGTTPSEPTVTQPVVEPVEKAVSTDNKRDEKKLQKLVKLAGEFNATLAELGLSGDDAKTEPSAGTEPVKKADSDDEPDDEKYTRLEKAVNDQSQLVRDLLDRISDGSAPGALKKSEPVDPLADLKATEDPMERLRAGFAVKYGR